MPTDRIAIDRARPGMLLAEDARDSGGRVLIAAGTSLGDAHLAALRARGVTMLAVTVAHSLSAEQRAAAEAVCRDTLARRFAGSLDDPVMRALHDAVLAYRLDKLA